MASIKSNALLPVMALLLLGMGAFVAIKSYNSNGEGDPQMDYVPNAANPDADSPAETIRTLQARVSDMTSETRALRRSNEQLAIDNNRLLEKSDNVERLVKRNVDQRMEEQAHVLRKQEQQSDSKLSSLMSRIDELTDNYKGIVSTAPADHRNSDIPVGLGLDDWGGNTIWHEPLDREPTELGTPNAAGKPRHRGMLKKTAYNTPSPAGSSARGGQLGVTTSSGSAAREPVPEPARPVYTVPENATLEGSTAFTALVGRIPVGGRVDPWPFKVITGSENMAANGLKLPEVSGMVWSGIAQGDWTLGCVRGWLTSVTFLFRDGRIRTISKGKNINKVVGENVIADEAIGWLSDSFGTPCISGKRVTNAAEYLTQRVALNAAKTAAEAAAAAQTSTIVSGALGTVTETIQNNDQYIIGKSVAGGVEEIDTWLKERQQQSFDAVFVRAGMNVAIHVTEALEIDYDPQGRKLRYANPHQNRLHSRLD